MIRIFYSLIVLLSLTLSGCANLREVCKVFWGSSTQALEEARVDAMAKKIQCSFDDCFEAVVEMARKKTTSTSVKYIAPGYEETSFESNNSSDKKEGGLLAVAVDPKGDITTKPVIDNGFFDIFIKDRIKGHIIVIGVEGNVNTTEVGIFFSPVSTKLTNIEISSLSSTAKIKVAQYVFDHLNQKFSKQK